MSKKIKYFKIINFFIILSFNNIFDINNNLKIKNHVILLQKIKKYENQIIITENTIKEFHKINSNNLLINNSSKFKKNNLPDITVVLTIFNQAHCLHKALRSIQNQSIENLEIIIIDDCSTDNSIDLIKNYQKEDSRIILIKHEVNKGTIKSRSDGIKIAKGKYITVIDGDDALIHKDILLHSLYVATLGKLDVVEFKMLIYKNRQFIKWHNKYLINTYDIIYQPKLRNKFFLLVEDYKIRPIQNVNICGKIIKNEVLKKVIIDIGPKYIETSILNYEDTIMTISLLQTAKSYYYMNENGYYYSNDNEKNIAERVYRRRRKVLLQDIIKLLQFIIEKTKNNKKERQIIFYEIIYINYHVHFFKNLNHDYKIVYNILDNVIKSRFISIKQKKLMLMFKSNLMEKEIKMKNVYRHSYNFIF